MKTGILTFTTGTNIGQRLQNYALQEILKRYADEVYTIAQTSPYSAVQQTKMRLKALLAGLKNPRKWLEEKKRERCFRDFNQKHIKFYPRRLAFRGENLWISKEFDAFVAGSDQVWNPKSPDVGDNYFLTFAKPDQRYTYAPSLSVEEIPEKDVALFRKRLQVFSEISVREDRGAEIIKHLTGKEAEVVLDPTLLLDREKWDEIKEPYPKKKKEYILCMFLGTTDIGGMDHIPEIFDKEILEIGSASAIDPAQFLDLVENAALVMTDSYHVSIFSILYHVPFIHFQREGTTINMNSRFSTLYRKLKLDNRNWSYLKDHREAIYSMDFEQIEKALEAERAKSFDFLDRTIGKH